MLTLKGTLLNIFKSEDFVNRDSGEVKKGKTKLQLVVEQAQKSGGIKKELLDVSIPDDKVQNYKSLKSGDSVSVDVGYMISGKMVIFYGV